MFWSDEVGYKFKMSNCRLRLALHKQQGLTNWFRENDDI